PGLRRDDELLWLCAFASRFCFALLLCAFALRFCCSLWLLRAGTRAALPGSLCIAAAAAAMRAAAARWIALIPLSAQGCAVSGTQATVAHFSGRSPKSAMPRACSLWLLSLARARESNPWGRRPHGSL